ncbi:MAG TPA: M20 family metallopeptidase [Candidatus Limnocylindria bacterium]|nr:M20 family metallopeptidase [Candidatus Limnocylindria bacterium]
MDVAALKRRLSERVDARADALDRLALAIHAQPELAFEERFAASALTGYLASEKVDVRRAAGGLETAFVAEAGSGGPVVAILGEYDALPGIGHACGHNLMGTAAVGAFLALRETLDGARGRVRVIGCPAEERGNGKVHLLKAGLFADVGAALMYHPGDRDEIDPLMLAMVNLDVELLGKAAHAAAEPHEGVNALDGLVLGWNALSALRLLVRSDSRIHGIITDGGKAANIIPDRAAARLMVRSPDNAYLTELRRRVLACFEGAAVATGALLRPEWSEVCEVVNTNRPLADAFSANAKTLGRTMRPRRPADTHGSTDMGNVTTVVPGIHPFLSITDGPVPGHSIAFTEAARMPRALDTMRLAAKALAMTALDALTDATLLKRAKEAHNGHAA